MSEDASVEAGDYAHLIPPLHDWLGLRIESRGSSTVISMDLTDEVRGPAPGTVHGGILATLADVTCAITLADTFDIASERPATTDMHIRYFRQPKGGPITAEGRLVFRGRRLLSAECSIVDAERRELARATATYAIVTMEGLPDARA
jgi:uncharacterized protein (TIGR00369 family)